jgi:acyl carrier protein
MDNATIRTNLREYVTKEVLRDASYPLKDEEKLISTSLIDSFSLMDLALWVENKFGVRIEDTELNADNFDTVAELASYIEQRQ